MSILTVTLNLVVFSCISQIPLLLSQDMISTLVFILRNLNHTNSFFKVFAFDVVAMEHDGKSKGYTLISALDDEILQTDDPVIEW